MESESSDSVFSEKVWMVGNFEGDTLGGPFSLEQIQRDVQTGKLQGGELLARMGTKRWRPIEKAMARAREIQGGAQATLVPPPPVAYSAEVAAAGQVKSDAASQAAQTTPTQPTQRYYLARPGAQPLGPLTTEQVISGIREGKVPPDTQACVVGEQSWIPLQKIPAFESLYTPEVTASSLRASSKRPAWILPVVAAVVVLALLGAVIAMLVD